MVIERRRRGRPTNEERERKRQERQEPPRPTEPATGEGQGNGDEGTATPEPGDEPDDEAARRAYALVFETENPQAAVAAVLRKAAATPTPPAADLEPFEPDPQAAWVVQAKQTPHLEAARGKVVVVELDDARHSEESCARRGGRCAWRGLLGE